MLDTEDILNGLLRGALSGRKKSWRGAGRAVRGSGLINAQTLLAAAGVAWGLYETWQGQQAQGAAPAGAAPAASGPLAAPPPLPGAAAPAPPAEESGLARARPAAHAPDGVGRPRRRRARAPGARAHPGGGPRGRRRGPRPARDRVPAAPRRDRGRRDRPAVQGAALHARLHHRPRRRGGDRRGAHLPRAAREPPLPRRGRGRPASRRRPPPASTRPARRASPIE